MNFELTISGLCVIVLKSNDGEQPAHPTAVDILCVGDHHREHRPRLTYRADDAIASEVAELVIDPGGNRIASLDLSGKILSLDLGNPQEQFSLLWGPDDAVVPGEERWMNWIPPVHFLGIQGIRRAGPGQLPEGAGARLTLQPGDLFARSIVPNAGTNDPIIWEYPAVGRKRALANEVVFSATGVQHVSFQWDGGSLFSSQEGRTVQMSISNDLTSVQPNGRTTILTRIEHLAHVGHLAACPAQVQVPVMVDQAQRTGHPICNQVLFVDSDQGQ